MIPRNASAVAASAASATFTLRQAAVSSARAAARAAPFSPAPSCSRSLSSSARWSAELSSPLRRPVGTSSAQKTKLMQRRGYASSSEGGSEKAKDRAAIGPFSVPSAVLFLATGAGLLWYFQSEKDKVQTRRRDETASAKVGRPRIGGPFQLTAAGYDPSDRTSSTPVGANITHEDLVGGFSLIYFGFTNCPDICPEELDKMSDIVEHIDALPAPYGGKIVQPVFVSCDPARDTVPATAKYIADFHPRLLGLTGSYEDVKAACKAYRVYFSTPPGADPAGDYLVDHSIFFYLMDPEGRFIDAFGRSVGPDEAKQKVEGYVRQWIDAGHPVSENDVKAKLFGDATRRVGAAPAAEQK